MKGLIICTEDSIYYGAGQLNCFAEYQAGRLELDINTYIDRYVNDDTQMIEFTPYSLYDAISLAEKIEKEYEPCRIVAFADLDEAIDEGQLEFIGYDVVADDYYTSPLGLEYLTMSLEESEFTDDLPFFENLDNEVRYDYASQLNEYQLFDDISWAEEIQEYCNFICEQYYNSFQGASDFKILKIYLKK